MAIAMNEEIISTIYQGDDEKPLLGMEFASLDEAYIFYNRYAKKIGFSVRKAKTVYRRNTKELMMKYFVCSKEGTSSVEVEKGRKRRRVIDREECDAKMVVSQKIGSIILVVTQFVEQHAHPLTSPRRIQFLRSHREVSTAKKQLSLQFSEVNIPMRQQISMYELQSGGVQNLGCTERDLYNYQRDLRKIMDGHDVQLLIEYFTEQQAKNSSFYYKMEVDDENRLDRLFWVDATSRRAYGFYGDVVVFDTTYNTNRYDMKFAPFVGVNKHGQTVVFACAFISHETTSSFVWAFDQFKRAMPNGYPRMIITDQAAAIANAIAQVFPETFHRLCIWHIQTKFSEKLDATSDSYCYKYFHDCIWKSETPKEFDLQWACVLVKTKTVGNEWLESIFQLRSKWVPAYVNHVFSAGMSSSQRVESTHAFFKRYVSKQNSLMEFIMRFNRALAHQRNVELEKEHIDITSQPLLNTVMSMEVQMAAIYTRSVFLKFQNEVSKILACVIKPGTPDENQENQTLYCVIERNFDGSSTVRKVVYDSILEFAWCSCRKFDSEGIPCTHLLAYLRMVGQIEYLPHEYILKRWTKAANSEMVVDEDGSIIHDVSDKSLLMHKSNLSKLSSELVELALVSETTTKILYQLFEKGLEQIKANLSNSGVCNSVAGTGSRCGENEIWCKDPIPSKEKGSEKRLKGGKEVAMGCSKRHCKLCGRVGHDRRKCSFSRN